MGVNCDWVSWVVYSKVENGSVSLLIICDCTVVSTVTYIRYKKYTFFYIFTGWARLNNLELKKLVLGKRKIEKSERNETKKKKKRNGHFFSRGGLWVEGTIIFNALPNSPLLLNYTLHHPSSSSSSSSPTYLLSSPLCLISGNPNFFSNFRVLGGLLVTLL